MERTRVRVQYLRQVEDLGFRFDHEAVVVDGHVHRPGCRQLPDPLPPAAKFFGVGDVLLAQRSPIACDRCRPMFVTLLSHQAQRAGVVRPHEPGWSSS